MADKAAPDIVVGGSTKRFRLPPIKNKKALIGIIAGIVLVLAVAGFAIIKILGKDSKNQETAQPKSYEQVTNDAFASIGLNKPDEAVNAWEEHLKSETLSVDEQYNSYIHLATSHMNTGNYDKAKEAFLKALSIKNTEDTVLISGLAMVEEQQGNKQAAIDYYKRLHAILKAKLENVQDSDGIQLIQDINTAERGITRNGGTL